MLTPSDPHPGRAAIARFVAERGDLLRRAAPAAAMVALVSAALAPALVPVVLGQATLATLAGGALQFLFARLQEKGADQIGVAIDRLLKGFEGRPAGAPAPSGEEVRAALEAELLRTWRTTGAEAAALREELSAALRALEGVQTALGAAPEELRQSLAQGFAELGGSFAEFRWVLSDLQQALADVRTRQAEQLALQREQLDLQRQQLVRLNLLLNAYDGRGAGEPGPGPADEAASAPAPIPCPYKGLAAFEPEDAAVFFGRAAQVAELCASLAASPVLAVVGPSGSGKSSLVRAGLLPALWGGALPGSADWPTAVLRPGPRPLAELAARLAVKAQLPPAALLRDLAADPASLDLAARAALAGSPPAARLLLVVDQLEELFTLCGDEAERRQVIAALLYAARRGEGRVCLVLTLRADFYGRCAAYPELAGAIQASQALVGPLDEAGLREAIVRPAERAGLRLEPGLVERILHDVDDAPGALPLLSHAMRETWARRSGATLTLAGYEATGGVRGALAKTAEGLFASLPAGEQAIARDLLLRLIEVGGEGAQDTRRRVGRAELLPEPAAAPRVEDLLVRLADARLITTGERSVEIAHEALISAWPRLAQWLAENREGLRVHHALAEAAQEWVALGRDAGALYRGVRLSVAEEWAGANRGELNAVERDFLAASRAAVAAAERERAAAARRLRLRAVALGIVAALALAAAGVAAWLGVRADRSAADARAQLQVATARRLAAQAGERAQTQLDLALLLGVEAYRADQGPEPRGALLGVLGDHPRLRAMLGAHDSPLDSVAFSPDGALVAAAGADGLLLWQAATARPLGAPLTDTAYLDLAFSPDGALIGAGRGSGTLDLWDPRGRRLVATFEEHTTGPMRGLAFSPDGRFLATLHLKRAGDSHAELTVWEAHTGRVAARLDAGDWAPAVARPAFSPDSRLLAAPGCREGDGASQGMVQLWDARSLIPLEPLPVGDYCPTTLAFSPGGGRLAVAYGDNSVKIWDLSTGQARATLKAEVTGIRSLAFSPDGARLAAGGGGQFRPADAVWDYDEQMLALWDLVTGAQLTLPLRGHNVPVNRVAFSPDGALLATASGHHGYNSVATRLRGSNTVLLWSVGDTLSLYTPLAYAAAPVEELVIGPAGEARGLTRESLLTWGAPGEPPRIQPLRIALTDTYRLALSPDGSLAAAISSRGRVSIWSAEGGPLMPAFTRAVTQAEAVAIAPDGGRLAAVTPATGGQLALQIWSVAGDQPSATPATLPVSIVDQLAFSPDGDTLAIASRNAANDAEILLWDVSTGAQHGEPLRFHTAWVSHMAFSPDGRRLATGGWDMALAVWDVSTAQMVGMPLLGHTGFISGLAFSPDGRTLASTGEGDAIRLWDFASGIALGQLPGPDGAEVSSMAFSPDGLSLWAGYADGHIGRWDMSASSWERLACSIAGRQLSEREWAQFLGDGRPYDPACAEPPAVADAPAPTQEHAPSSAPPADLSGLWRGGFEQTYEDARFSIAYNLTVRQDGSFVEGHGRAWLPAQPWMSTDVSWAGTVEGDSFHFEQVALANTSGDWCRVGGALALGPGGLSGEGPWSGVGCGLTPAGRIGLERVASFADNFADPGSGWGSGSDENTDYGYSDGEYRIGLRPDDWWRWVSSGLPAAAYRVEVDVRSAGDASGEAALAFGLPHYGKGFYVFGLGRSGRYELSRWDGQEWEMLIDWTESAAVRDEGWNRLGLTYDAGALALAINGEEVAALDDVEIPPGGVGLFAQNFEPGYEARFDNFRMEVLRP